MTYLVIDLETTDKKVHGRVGNPFYNSILTAGLKYHNKDALALQYEGYSKELRANMFNGAEVLIGHNIKYDLLYLWRDEEIQTAFKNGMRIWDTQLVEYMLTAQQHKYPALRDIAVNKYGCEPRIKHIEEGYKQGLDTSQIDIELLLVDVRNDVLDTEHVAIQQCVRTKILGMHRLIAYGIMDALLATTEMEYNGVKVDSDKLLENKYKLQEQLETSKQYIRNITKDYWPAELEEFNPDSSQQLSIILFGGEVKTKGKECIGEFKTGPNKGLAKYKSIDVLISVPGMKCTPHTDWRGAKEGIYSTNEAVLKVIAKKLTQKLNHPAGLLATELLKIRYLNKQINTYYTSTQEYIHSFDSCVHTQLCHCGYEEKDYKDVRGGTSTGRLSSTKPNMQNQPSSGDSKVKEHFISRYEDGVLIEFDYKQLEVVVFAFLTQDRQLISDITEGKDIHKILASQLHGIGIEDVTEKQRKAIKPCTFHVVYGGGPNSLSQRTGLELDFCELFIEEFYKRYPQSKQWQTNLVKIVKSNKKLLVGQLTKKGCPKHESYYKSTTGRLYRFETNDSPDWLAAQGVLTGFNPPDIKNYPVQGFATADIVQIMIGRVWRNIAIYHRDKFLLVNTVHDSLLIDCKREYCNEVINMVKSELESVPKAMKEIFDINFNVPVGVDYKMGDNWMM